MSHVLSASVSGSVVDAHILIRNSRRSDIVHISGSFQEDDSETSSAAEDWVQGLMTAAYSGTWRLRMLPTAENNLLCKVLRNGDAC